MANPIITALITDKVTQSSGADRITDSEVREVLNAINAFIQDDFAYNTAIPFTCMRGRMAAHTVISPTVFTINTTNAAPRASMVLRLTSGGTVPDFSAFKKQGGSQNWDNTDGALNVVMFWYDGTDYWYCIFQEDTDIVGGSGLGSMIIGSTFIIG